ncbi:hypothetical protein Bca4012_005985 [Brassica carinata]
MFVSPTNSGGSLLRNKIPWILWQLWKAHNRLSFEKIQTNPSEIWGKAEEEADIWLELNGFSSVVSLNWQLQTTEQRNWQYPLRIEATESLSSLHLCNIVVEASFLEAREVIMDRFSQSPFQGLKMRISGYFAFLGPWSLNHTDPARNGVARAIADSVTSEERYNSFV